MAVAPANGCPDGVEQLTRYLDPLDREPLLPTKGPVRGIACAVIDYDLLRGMDDPSDRLF